MSNPVAPVESDLPFTSWPVESLGTQAPEIDGSILINDVPEGVLPATGDFVNVEITEAHEYDLIGRISA